MSLGFINMQCVECLQMKLNDSADLFKHFVALGCDGKP